MATVNLYIYVATRWVDSFSKQSRSINKTDKDFLENAETISIIQGLGLMPHNPEFRNNPEKLSLMKD